MRRAVFAHSRLFYWICTIIVHILSLDLFISKMDCQVLGPTSGTLPSFKNTNLAHRKKFQVISDSRKRKQRRSPSWRSLQIFGGRFMEYTQKYNQGVSKQWIFKRMRAVKLPEGKTPWTWGAHGRRWNQFTLWKLSEDWKCIKDRYRSGRSPGEGNGNPL